MRYTKTHHQNAACCIKLRIRRYYVRPRFGNLTETNLRDCYEINRLHKFGKMKN